MSHLAVRTLLEDVAKSLSDNIQFGYGRRSQFNILTKDFGVHPPFIWLLPMTAAGRFRNQETKTKRWNINLLFMDQEASSANVDESASVLDVQDNMVDKFTQALDDWYEKAYDTMGAFTIENDTQTPFYKEDADIHTGWLLSFQMVVSDGFNYCSPEDIDLYANTGK